MGPRDDDEDEEFDATLGDDDFDYEEFVQREFDGRSRLKPLWLFTAWVVLIAVLLPFLVLLVRLL